MVSLLFFCGMKKIMVVLQLALSLAGCAQMNKSIVNAAAYCRNIEESYSR